MKFRFGKAKRDHGNGDMSWRDDAFRPLLVTSSYTPSQNVDEFMSDIPGGALVTGGLGEALTGKTVSNAGVFDADDGFIPAVPAGQVPAAIVIVQYTGTPSSSRLWCFTNEGVPLPIATDGSDVHLRWPSTGIAS